MKNRRRLRRAPRLFRPLVECLEDRRLLAAVITVNSTLDSNTRDNALTLREAILVNNRTLTIASLSAAEQAQVSGASTNADADTINFAITGSGVQTISPASPLPTISDPVTINGYSQTGSSANTNSVGQGLNSVLMIELAGNTAGTGAIGLRLGAGSGGSTIKGLAINRFAAQGIQIDTSGNKIAGNFIGTNAAGTSALPNGDNGVIIFSGSNNVIGGTSSADRNLLSGNDDNGVVLVFAAANGNIIQGNLIGTDLTGTQDLGNVLFGIYSFQAVNTVIGGTAPGAGNLISGNNVDGIQFQGGSNNATIQGNLLGVNVGATAALPNSRDGIRIEGTSGTKIGGDAGGNTIAHNGAAGVAIVGGGLGNTVLSNSIFANGGLGIDLGDDGPDFPQDLKGFQSIQRGQNFPIITSVAAVAGGTEIRGIINNEHGPADLRLQFFASAAADASGFGEGQTLLGEVTISVGSTAVGAFTALVNPLPSGQAIVTATATGLTTPSGFTGADGTSEFSPPFNPTVYTVTSTADAGAGSLREVIIAANAHLGADRIEFAIPATDAGHVYYANDGIAGQVTLANVTPTTAASDAAISNIDPDWPHSWFLIAPASALPTISDSVIIDGYTQGQGTAATNDDATANTNTVVSKLGLNTVLRIELTGKNAGQLTTGILHATAGGNTIRGLAINRTQGYQIYLDFQSGGNSVAGNFLGPDISGTRAFTPALGSDALVALSLAEDVIGGTTAAARNLISGNTGPGFQVAGIFSNAGDRIEGNLIGTDRTGTRAVANEKGIYTGSASNTLIGGSDPNATNVISGNINVGVEPRGKTIIQNNLIGTDVSGTLPLGNGAGVEAGNPGNNQIIENHVAFNGVGVRVANNGSQGNLITRNSILSNTALGIEFSMNAVVPNDLPPASDPPDQDTGPNALQNFPVLTSVTNLNPGTRIQGTLTSAPSSNFRLEFFANADRDVALFVSGALPGQLGEGQTYIGSLDVTTNASGVFNFSADLPVSLLALAGEGGQPFVTATATNITPVSGVPLNNTSQFSPVVPLGGPSVVVTSTRDSGLGTLREAIFNANLTPNRQVITFAISASDPRHFYYKDDGVAGFVSVANIATTTAATDAAIPTAGPDAIDPDWPHSWFSIQPGRALPDIADTVLIDGYSQPGAIENTIAAPQGLNTVLKVELDGTNVAGGIGLRVAAGENSLAHEIRGLAINRWRFGIYMDFSVANQVAGNFIGSDVSGTIALGNTNGVFVSAVAATIGGLLPEDRNLISGNSLTGVRLFHFGGTSIYGNLFGTDPSGNVVIGTASNGLFIEGTTWVTVGGDLPGASNVFALVNGPGGQGITVTSDTTSLQNGINSASTASAVTAQDDNPCFPFDSPLEALKFAADDMGSMLNELHALGGNNDDYSSEDAQRLLRDLRSALDYFDRCKKVEPHYEKIGYPLRKNVEAVRDLKQLPPAPLGIAAAAVSDVRLAIDLDGNGVTANDLGDVDEGAFGGQNYPVLTSATNINGGTQIVGTLNSLSNATFQIDLFSNLALHPTGYGPGETLLATITVTTNSSGNASFTYLSPTLIPAGRFITSLATQLIDLDNNPVTPLEPFESSEFSAGIVVKVANPWHNYAKPLDVKADGFTVAGDALEIINFINAFRSQVVPAGAMQGVPAYYDTTNDGFVAPNDVLEIINYINAFGADREGEAGEGEAMALSVASDDWLALLAMDLAGQPSLRKKGT